MTLNGLTALTGMLSVHCKEILKPVKKIWEQIPFLKQTADEYLYKIQWRSRWRMVIRLIKGFPFHMSTWLGISIHQSNNFNDFRNCKPLMHYFCHLVSAEFHCNWSNLTILHSFALCLFSIYSGFTSSPQSFPKLIVC